MMESMTVRDYEVNEDLDFEELLACALHNAQEVVDRAFVMNIRELFQYQGHQLKLSHEQFEKLCRLARW